MTSFGLGMYTLADAAKLIRSEPRKIRRWLYGYAYTARRGQACERREMLPLWSPQYDLEELGEAVIGFQDLLELRVVREFVTYGVPLQVVRRCLQTAREVFGSDHPLANHRFVTDGATIFADSLEAEVRAGEHDGELLDLRSRQYAFRSIIKDSLYTGIEYENGRARRWYPQPRSRVVVVDPACQFGHPMIESCGVPTAALYSAFLAEGRQKAVVARLFDVSPREVEAAVRFEEQFLQAA